MFKYRGTVLDRRIPLILKLGVSQLFIPSIFLSPGALHLFYKLDEFQLLSSSSSSSAVDGESALTSIPPLATGRPRLSIQQHS